MSEVSGLPFPSFGSDIDDIRPQDLVQSKGTKMDEVRRRRRRVVNSFYHLGYTGSIRTIHQSGAVSTEAIPVGIILPDQQGFVIVSRLRELNPEQKARFSAGLAWDVSPGDNQALNLLSEADKSGSTPNYEDEWGFLLGCATHLGEVSNLGRDVDGTKATPTLGEVDRLLAEINDLLSE